MYNYKSKEFWHWILSLFLCGIFIIWRRESILDDQLTTIDKIIIPVFIALFILPLISEFSFLGISLKKDILEVKADIKDSIHNLQITMNNRMDSHININNVPSSDNVLQQMQELLHNAIKDKGIKEVNDDEIDVPEENILLFKYMFAIEKEIKRLWISYMGDEDSNYPLTRMLDVLVKREILPFAMKGAIKEIYALTSFAIHGGEITLSQTDFVKKTGKEILGFLREV